MSQLATILLLIGIAFLLVGRLVGRVFYRKRSIAVTKPLFTPPPGAAIIAPSIKHSLQFWVPRNIQTDESAEVSVEYFQGITHILVEGIHTFLYDQLDILPRALPNSLRGLFWSTSVGQVGIDFITNQLEEDLSIRLASSKFSIAPEDWLTYKKGTSTPCRWRWTVSCHELGRYDLVVDFNEPFRKYFPDELGKSLQVIFQVEVRSSIGLSLWTIRALRASKYIAIGVGSILSVLGGLVMFILNLPFFQESFSNILKQLLS